VAVLCRKYRSKFIYHSINIMAVISIFIKNFIQAYDLNHISFKNRGQPKVSTDVPPKFSSPNSHRFIILCLQ